MYSKYNAPPAAEACFPCLGKESRDVFFTLLSLTFIRSVLNFI